MSTYVGDPLYIVCTFLRWRDVVRSQMVNKEWYKRVKLKDRRTLQRLSRHTTNQSDIPKCILTGMHIWHPVWDGPFWVWTPSFEAYKLIQYGPDISFPVQLGQDWMLWIMRLKRHLGIERNARFIRGKRRLMHTAKRYRALVSFRVKKNILLFKIVRLQALGPIYKRARKGTCATLRRG